ncbi:hypothetical protein [Streptomyces gardneri]|uniref:hypothetical protein n=1 Tax=Streptomyces gardneri TaxID=66892 RepID=UPI0035DB49D9
MVKAQFVRFVGGDPDRLANNAPKQIEFKVTMWKKVGWPPALTQQEVRSASDEDTQRPPAEKVPGAAARTSLETGDVFAAESQAR